ncbi:protein ENL isoform X3 [Rana temporaria]|uniref:protein ENL isoform X3 n=1 Tax=Rana temporaria TaxID=8407 RepID=UPI001AAC8358|nr:protein ENL isoform X3 [Rana temporaria]
MDSQCTVQVKLELGHRAQLRKKPTTDGFTHDWMVFVRGPEQFDIQHFVEKVVFRLHDSFPRPKRVCKEPPYKVEESGYAGFILPIEVYFKNKEEPKKVCFTYDLFLNLEGNPPVNHLRCEKLTFNNPTKEFRRKLLKAGGVMVMPEGAETVSRPSPDYPMLPTIPLSAFSDPKKAKPSSHPSKESSKDSNKASKPHKVTKEHRERMRKDSESKSKESDISKPVKESSSSRKPAENKPTKEEKAPVKVAFKEQKLTLKEPKLENMSPKGGPSDAKPSSKRPPNIDSPKSSSKKPKKGNSKGLAVSTTSPRAPPNPSNPVTCYTDKKVVKEKPVSKTDRPKPDPEVKKAVEADDSNSDEERSSKSVSIPSSPSNSSSTSDSSSESDFEPSQNHSQGPLRSMVEDLQSEESDDDSSCGEEVTSKNKTAGRDSRMSLSDSDSDSSDDSCIPSRGTTPIQKMPPTNNKNSGHRSPETCSKSDKMLKKGVYDKAYTDELVDLHRRLMALRERNILQQVANGRGLSLRTLSRVCPPWRRKIHSLQRVTSAAHTPTLRSFEEALTLA